jgi:sugar lactone lactonase YvrE
MKIRTFILIISLIVISVLIGNVNSSVYALTNILDPTPYPEEKANTDSRIVEMGYQSKLEIDLIDLFNQEVNNSENNLKESLQSVYNQNEKFGQPGLSYRYVTRFGTSEQPYIDDSSHLNNPCGVGTYGNTVWIAEGDGRRSIKFDSNGNYVTQIGKAGFRYASGTTLQYLTDVTVDSSGNIWVVDAGASHIIKFDSNLVKKQELGDTWDSGDDDSHFDFPNSIAFDTNSNIYVSDTGNNRIQVFNPSGESLLATISGLSEPARITVDSLNLLYIADAGNHRIQIYNVSNPASISLVGTLGTGSPGSNNNQFNYPEGVAVDVLNNRIFIADAENFRVQVYNYTTRNYQQTIDVGSYVYDVGVDLSGNLYVVQGDSHISRVFQYNKNLDYVRIYGTDGVPYVTNNKLYNNPTGLAIADDGSVYIGEGHGRRLVKVNSDGDYQWKIGTAGVWDAFAGIEDVDLDATGNVYVVDRSYHKVVKFDENGTYINELGGDKGTGDYQFNYPYGVAIGPNGKIFVADTNNHRIEIFNSDLTFYDRIGTTGVSGNDNNHFSYPVDIDIDTSGNIYIVDQDNNRVQVYNNNLTYLQTIPDGWNGNSGDDYGHFEAPTAITVDNYGRIFVADGYGSRVLVFDNTGAFLTAMGNSGGNRCCDMRSVTALAVDKAGNLYVGEGENHRIQKFSSGVPGWVQLNLNGFGTPNNGNIHTLASFESKLYAGTYNGNDGAQMWNTSDGKNWTSLIESGFGDKSSKGLNHLFEFKDKLYAGVRNETDGGKIYRLDNGDWDLVVTNGFTDTLNSGIYRFEEFNNHIYAGASIFNPSHGAEIWRSTSGDDGSWDLVVGNGFDSKNNYIWRTSKVYDGYIYFGSQNIDTYTWDSNTGAVIIRSDTGDEGDWSKVIDNGFGDLNNFTISSLESYNSYLYASTGSRNWKGIQVWRCQSCDNPDDWELVVDNGFNNVNNRGLSTLIEFENYLYLFIGNYYEGMQVWRTDTGNNGDWEQVSVGGFGDCNNQSPYFNNVIVHNGNLHVGTENGVNGGEVWLMLDKKVYLPIIDR